MSEPKPITLVAPSGRRVDVPTAEGAASLKANGYRDLNESELRFSSTTRALFLNQDLLREVQKNFAASEKGTLSLR